MKGGRDERRRCGKKEAGDQSNVLKEVSWVESDKKGHVSQGTQEDGQNDTL